MEEDEDEEGVMRPRFPALKLLRHDDEDDDDNDNAAL
mgnify:CR=1 FL=1